MSGAEAAMPAESGATWIPAMAVEELRVRAGTKELLHGVSADFPSNRVTAIIGPTGCGKTTLLRALNRLHETAAGISVSGGVRLGDRDIYTQVQGVRELRRRVGMVFQRPNPFPLSILENLTVGPRVHGLARRSHLKDLAEQKLTEVGLWDAVKDRLHTSPFSLSGGQQQLLCFARALSVQPEVLLLDEPTSSLDPATSGNIEQLIKGLHKDLTVIMVSHNLGQVRRVANHVLFLLAGERVEFTDVDTFFEAPADDRTRTYIAGEVAQV
ncbi:MAG TPA: phosphate ABC transporter ATP-binding protein [Candidatus Binatia bacterium]|nr:phosphate ABC transporter ATP-binding protein [Candidatus Binatia bacterium]